MEQEFKSCPNFSQILKDLQGQDVCKKIQTLVNIKQEKLSLLKYVMNPLVAEMYPEELAMIEK